MTRNFIFRNSTSQKWWSIEVNEISFTTRYGKVEGKSSSTVKSFATEEKCQQAAGNLIAQKLKEKYEEVSLHVECVPVWDLLKFVDARKSKVEELEISAHQSTEFTQLICSLTSLKSLTITNLKHLPAAISQLKHLRKFDISESRELKIIPPEIGQLKKLEFLHIRHTGIKKLPDSIGQLSKLIYLSICQNEKLQALPASINQLSQLSTFYATFNRTGKRSGSVLKLPENLLDNLNKLKHLNLTCNNLTSLPPALVSCKKIHRLDLSLNKFREIPEEVFKLTALEHLNFDDMPSFKVIPEAIVQLKKLRYFSFEKEVIKNIPEERLQGGIFGIRKHFAEK